MLRSILKATALASFMLATPAFAQSQADATSIMTSAEIHEIAVGKTTFGTFADRPLSYAVYVAPDGRMIGRLMDGASERIETGTWRIENDHLIGQWDDLKDGTANAFAYVRVGDNVHAIRDDGSLDRVQFFVDGDPLGLEALMKDGDLTTLFARKLEAEYFHLWRDTPEEPFSVIEAENLYVMDERLRALDGDALAVPGQDSRLEGWDEYVAVWPTAFEGIATFVPGPVLNLDVKSEGNWALTSFDMAGSATLETGEAISVFKHFTLIWTRTSEGWRILHEHISDTTNPNDL